MDSMTNFRLEEANRLVRWALTNPGEWNNITTREDMNQKLHLTELLKALKEAELYQIIVVVLALNHADDGRQLCTREIARVWNRFVMNMWSKDTLLRLTDEIIHEVEKNELFT